MTTPPTEAPDGRPAIAPRTPVIVGVGQFLNRVDRGASIIEPVGLIEEATRRAAADAGAEALLSRIDVIGCSRIMLWRYQDPGRLVAERIGAENARTWYPDHGGNTPQSFVNRMAVDIADGRLDVGLICGGEAGMSRKLARRQGIELDWTQQAKDVHADWWEPEGVGMLHPAELAAGTIMPTTSYPLIETALWHESGRSLNEHLTEAGELWAGFARVAATNPDAWDHHAPTAQQIIEAGPANRFVGWPYTRSMVANPDVDMAAAIIICAAETADRLGIPRDRWVFPHSGSDAVDPMMTNRPSFTASTAIREAGAAALRFAGVGVDDLVAVDVYSCFPSAVSIACRELGVDTRRPLTTWGGLTFGGGPWNNPVSHAIATMVQRLREEPGGRGLITANGGNLQKHAFGVYSTDPPADGVFRHAHLGTPDNPADLVALHEPEGTASRGRIEAWTVLHDRTNSPTRAHAVVRTDEGARVWAHQDDPAVMAEFVSGDQGGRRVTVTAANELHLE